MRTCAKALFAAPVVAAVVAAPVVAQGVACCDVVDRSAVYDGGRPFFDTLDRQTIALDAKTSSTSERTRSTGVSWSSREFRSMSSFAGR